MPNVVKPAMFTRRVGSLLVIRQSRHPATASEWSELMSVLAEALAEGALIKGLVVTDGGGPDSGQRAALKAAMAGKAVRTAVVSNSLKLRFVAAGIALFNPGHRAFSLADMQQAYAYLELTPSEQRAAEKVLAQMSQLLAA